MAHRRPTRFVALTELLSRHRPDLEDVAAAVVEGRVVVDGATITNPNARVRADAGIRVVRARRLRGEAKLAAALDAFDIDVRGAVGVDVGAAAGGFTSALLKRGAARIYAVDVGFGQLAGSLRADARVINLERTNVATLDTSVVSDEVGLIVTDLSYLPVAIAVRYLDRIRLSARALLIALVKPTFELQSGSLVTDDESVRIAIRVATDAIEAAGWCTFAITVPRPTGARGAIEAFVAARRPE
jgi:23S rRNA (cytidine1920-2'-O)/16S rRNA (cytidine1409-2'-O)-methyltransferase